MLSTREIASLILLGTVISSFIVVPKLRRTIVPSLWDLLKSAFAWKLLIVYILVVLVSAGSTTLGWLIGLWDWRLLKDAILLTGAVVLPMTMRAFSFKSGSDLVHKLVRDTLSLTALLVFYLDTSPLPLIGELVLQTFATFLVMMQAFARTKSDYLPAKKLFDVLLFMLGTFLLVWTTLEVVTSPPDWSEVLRSLLFSFWMPLTLLPFFYSIGFFVVAETVLARFTALQTPLTVRRVLAVLVGCRLKLSLIKQLNGRYNYVAHGSGFRDGLRLMRDFRADLQRRHADESQRLALLEQNVGQSGIDVDGFHIDRREFDVTKKRLDWIWTCQNAQFERQGNRYWDHLSDLIVDSERHGLPAEHGFVVEVAAQAQVWRSWRRTPGGAILGTGGAEHGSQFYFQGDVPPTTWPGSSPDWVDAAREAWPPDWNKDDGSRL